MGISVSSRLTRSLSVVVLVAAAISFVPGAALAETQVSQTGTIGDVYFTDTFVHPGSGCFYSGAAGTFHFDGLKVKSFKVQWPDQNVSVREHGTVVYRMQIQHWNGSSWDVVKNSTPVKVTAYDNTQTAFAGRTLSWTGAENNEFRAGVTLKWIKSNGTVSGRSKYYLDYYRLGYDASVSVQCPATWHA